MSTPSSSKPSPEAASTPAFNANLPFPTNEVEPNSEASANEQNAFVLQWLLARGHKTVAKQLEEEMKSGKAGSDPIVIPGDPGSDEEGDANNKDAEGKPALAKRRASARLAKQTQKETISAQELVTKNAPKGAAAVQAAVSAANAAATSTTAAASTAAAAKKGVARGKSPTSAMKSPTTSTHPPLKPSGSGSKVGTSTTITADHGLKSPTPASSTPTVPTPDATQLFNLLSSIITASSSMAANATTTTTPQQAQSLTANLIATLNKAGMTIDEAMARDPVDKQQGYKDLEAWVEGALDMYRPEFRPILFPVFVHFYLELVLEGFKEAAVTFYKTYAPSLSISHTNILQHLQTITLPHHVNEDELAQRFRSEKYVIRMSRSGFGLMLGWLMEGSGGEAMGAGEGFGGDSNKRGRAAVRRILNDRIDVDVTSASTTEVHPSAWEENTGLLSSIVPSADGASTSKFVPSPAAFNQARGQLKLGPMPLDQGLLDETQRTLREEAESEASLTDGMNGVEPTGKRRLTVNTGHDPTLVAPSASDLLPRPPSFKAIDVKREVEKVRDARKRIRLEPSTLSGSDVELGLDRAALFAKSGALPSICAYTFHDAADGVCSSVFSADSSLMAAGFSESYIRLWSLKGEKLRGMRSDFNPSSIKDASSLKKAREKHGSTTRRLIAHSGPVYGLSFDPIAGTAGPPKYLLSSSADATTRLWSLETMSNLVVYRGHQNPVWDVEWSPMGVYFATGSRDRTARLWSTERTYPLRIFAGHLSDVDCVKFHPNSLYLATGSSDSTCRLWDVQRGSCMRVFLGHQGPITSLAMSPDGKYLASASTDLSIHLWDLGSGKKMKKMMGHTSLINSLSFSACSSMLVSGSSDWTARCWDVKGPGGSKSKKAKDDVEVDGFGLASRGGLVGGVGATGAREEGKLPEGDESDKIPTNETADLLITFPTKRTPIVNVHFTPRNLCLVSGAYIPPPAPFVS